MRCGAAMRRQYILCMITKECALGGRIASKGSVYKTSMGRRRCTATPEKKTFRV